MSRVYRKATVETEGRLRPAIFDTGIAMSVQVKGKPLLYKRKLGYNTLIL